MLKIIDRVYNFNPGPSALPEDVLKKAQEELLNFHNSGMSVMELSHRSTQYASVHNEAIQLLTELLNIPETHQVLFIQGGASMQFGMIPLNFLHDEQYAAYILSGSFAEKAHKDAMKIGNTYIPASTKAQQYRCIPKLEIEDLKPNTAYVHLTSNNTIYGTQWSAFPTTGDVPLIADMSSDILSRQIDVSQFQLIYAGAQKNLGPSGITVVIIEKAFLERKVREAIPSMLDYHTYATSNSLHNTPPTFTIYMLNLVLQWVKEQGGMEKLENINNEKANIIYTVIDDSNDFYLGHAEKDDRSKMNITFRLPNDELERTFVAEATARGFHGIKGHRSVGGFRVSAYNAVSYEACEDLAQFMREFAAQHA